MQMGSRENCIDGKAVRCAYDEQMKYKNSKIEYEKLRTKLVIETMKLSSSSLALKQFDDSRCGNIQAFARQK